VIRPPIPRSSARRGSERARGERVEAVKLSGLSSPKARALSWRGLPTVHEILGTPQRRLSSTRVRQSNLNRRNMKAIAYLGKIDG
jgi:hypothetical protein